MEEWLLFPAFESEPTPESMWVNINHPCYEIDLVAFEEACWPNEESARVQGYIPLEELRRIVEKYNADTKQT